MSDKINKEALAAHRKKVRDDWFTIRALLKIDMKSRFGYGTRIGAGNVGKWIFNLIMSGLMYAIIVCLIFLFTQMFVARPGLRDSYIVIVSMASIILQFFICTATLIKALYYSGDNEILLRFPVNGTQIFIAKSIFRIHQQLFDYDGDSSAVLHLLRRYSAKGGRTRKAA